VHEKIINFGFPSKIMESIYASICTLAKKIGKYREIPKIKRFFHPKKDGSNKAKGKCCTGSSKSKNFGAVELNSGAIGVYFLNLKSHQVKNPVSFNEKNYVGKSPLSLLKKLATPKSLDIHGKSFALGTFNALSQHLFTLIGNGKEQILQSTSDSLGGINPKKEDTIGMVGYFPPLVKSLQEKRIPLNVIELKKTYLQKTELIEVTLDITKLRECNKVLCTATTLLNNSIDEVLDNCKNAEIISVIGPSAGFIPDFLFERGVDIVGGSYITKPSLFWTRMKHGEKWGNSTKKYTIRKEQYPGIEEILKKE